MGIFRSKISHIILFVAVVGIIVVNAIFLSAPDNNRENADEILDESAESAKLELVVLTASGCTECFDVHSLLAPLRENPQIQITKEELVEYTSDEGAVLISKYEIARVPTVVLRGQTDTVFDAASFVQNLGKKDEDGSLVVTNVPAPYVEVASGVVKGKFIITFITDTGCKECYNVETHRQALVALAMKPSEERFVDRLDSEGVNLVAKYKIESTPTIILMGELSEYPQLQQIWSTVGTVEEDGAYIFRAGQSLMGAYHNLTTGQIVTPPPPEPKAQ